LVEQCGDGNAGHVVTMLRLLQAVARLGQTSAWYCKHNAQWTHSPPTIQNRVATMVRQILVIAAFACFLLGTLNVHAESESERTIVPAISAQNWNVSELVGQKVCTMKLNEVGKIRDLVMSPDGKIVYAAISFEGFTKNDNKLYAVPMEAIYLTWTDGKVENVRIDVTEDKIKQLTAFDKNHEPLFADASFGRDRSDTAKR